VGSPIFILNSQPSPVGSALTSPADDHRGIERETADVERSVVTRATLALQSKKAPGRPQRLPAGQQRTGLLARKACHWTPGLKVVGSVQHDIRSRP
jgi:hypothetical protein